MRARRSRCRRISTAPCSPPPVCVGCPPDHIDRYISDEGVTVTAYPNGTPEPGSLYVDSYLEVKDKYSSFLGEKQAPCASLRRSTQTPQKSWSSGTPTRTVLAPFLTQNFSEIHLFDPRYNLTSVKDYVAQNEIDSVVVLYSISNFTAQGQSNVCSGTVSNSESPPVYQPSYQVYRGKPCAPRVSGGFFLLVLGAGLPKVYQGHFLREKPGWFLPSFLRFEARFGACKGRYAVIVGLKSLFPSSLRGISFLLLAENYPPRLNLKGGIPMRNLKRALSLGLTAAMISGLMVMGAGAVSYPDSDQIQNQTAVEILGEIGVHGRPTTMATSIPLRMWTRAEMAVIITRISLWQ